MNLIKYFIVPIALCTSLAYSEDDNGLYLGGGILTAKNSSCDTCQYSATQFEVGYEFNEIVAIEFKYASGENEDIDSDLTIGFLGANIGHDFNTGWFRFYGKAGLANIKETGEDYYDGYLGEYYEEDSYKDTAFTAGLGVKMVLSGRPSGAYLKFESMAVTVNDGSASAAFLASLGYRI